MAEWNDLYLQLINMGMKYVEPKQEKEWNLVSMFHPLIKYEKRLNEEYEQKIHSIAEQINQSRLSPGKDISIGGQKILRHLYTPHLQGGQQAIESFLAFQERTKKPRGHHRFIALDTETLGEQGKENLSVVEIGAVEFKKNKSGEYIESGKKFSLLIRPTQETEAYLRDLLQQIKQDPYRFNQLSEADRTSLLNLIRYDTEYVDPERGILPARLNDPLNIRHNTLVNQIDLKKESIERYIPHMERGLEALLRHSVIPEEAITQYNRFLRENRSKYFITYNGLNFDLPVLREWGKKIGLPVSDPRNHIDFMRLLQTVYPNPLDLHRRFGRNSFVLDFQEGSYTLNELRRTLGFGTEQSHSALYDAGTHGLGGVFARMRQEIERSILAARRKDVPSGFRRHQAALSWTNEPLRKGQVLFSLGGIQAYDGNVMDFQAIRQDGKFVPYSNAFNTTVLNSKTFYTVQGVRKMNQGDQTAYALQLYDEMNDRYVFIVREGKDAARQLQDFVHRHFVNWEGLSSDQKRAILRLKEADNAIRAYERLFSLEGAGQGVTSGFEAARRMYRNAEIYARRLAGKSARLEEAAREYALERAEDLESFRRLKKERFEELKKSRLTHEEMIRQMDFRSKWDPKTRQFVENESERRYFWRMTERLLSELPAYSQAIRRIEAEIQDPQRRDIAWHLFNKKIENLVGPHRTMRHLAPFEGERIVVRDGSLSKEYSFNTRTIDTLMGGLYRYLTENEVERNDQRRRDRFLSLLSWLERDQMLPKKQIDYVRDHFHQTGHLHDALRLLAMNLMNAKDIKENKVEVASLSRRPSVEALWNHSREKVEQAITEAIQEASREMGRMVAYQAAGGKKYVFDPEIQRFLESVDQPHPTGIRPRNKAALEHILESYTEAFRKSGLAMHSALSLKNDGRQVRITFYRPEDSTSVMTSLLAGETHHKAIHIDLPLIFKDGTHAFGNRQLNARTILEYVNGQIIPRSSVEMIAREFTRPWVMERIAESIREQNFEEANKRIRRVLNSALEELSGASRGLDYRDQNIYRGSLSDFFRQGAVDLERAMIHHQWDLYRQGKQSLLSPEDFSDSAFVSEDRTQLKYNVSLDDLTPVAQERLRRYAPQWAETYYRPLFVSGLKGDTGITRLTLSHLDIRDFTPYGYYTRQFRDNMVQFQNMADITDNARMALEKAGVYVNFNPLVMTKAQRLLYERYGKTAEVNLKVAFMTQEELDARIRAMMQTEAGRELLRREGILRKDGTVDPVRWPRVYEQQALMVKEIGEQFAFDDFKDYHISPDFRLNPKIAESGYRVKPGDIIGYHTQHGEKNVPVRYEGVFEAVIDNPENFMTDRKIRVRWQEMAHKFAAEGEKMTAGPTFSKEFIEAITGAPGVSIIYSMNAKKHEFYGPLLTGQAKLLADYVSRMREKDRQVAIRMIEEGGVYLKWRDGYFEEYSKGQKIEIDAFEKLFEKLNRRFAKRYGPISGQVTIEDDRYNLKGRATDIAIQNVRPMRIPVYAKVVDETGRPVIDLIRKEDGTFEKVYKNEIDGASWGHRELGVLHRIGAYHTFEYAMRQMKKQGMESGRWAEHFNMVKALEAMIYPSQIEAPTFTLADFNDLPAYDNTREHYRGTILDPDFKRLSGGNIPEYGFWLELPKMPDGADITLNVYGRKEERVPINRIFIPLTVQRGQGKKVWMDSLQQKIANIYRRAQEVQNAKSIEEARVARNNLQQAVNEYINQLAYDITSSHGRSGEGLIKTKMPVSMQGLLKILPVSQSIQLEEEITYISPEEARKMGVYDMIVKGNKPVYAMTLRYPTFHQDAMQITQLRVDPSVRPGEIHTTAYSAMLQRGDSDGDKPNFVVIKDPKVQKEWERLYQLNRQRRMENQETSWRRFLESQLAAQSTEDRIFNLKILLQHAGHEKYLEGLPINTQEEIAAKSGKALVGQASDLNYKMRQLAYQVFGYNAPETRAIETFGDAIEQQLISSKHGFGNQIELTVKSGALAMLDALRSGNWQEALRIDEQYFDSMFTTDYQMKQAMEAIARASDRIRSGLNNTHFKIGTSTGWDVERTGLKQLVDTLMDRSTEKVDSNAFLNIHHELMGRTVDVSHLSREVQEKVTPLQLIPSRKKEERRSRIREFLDRGKNRQIAYGLGAALAAIMGYNILKDGEPIVPLETASQGHYNVQGEYPDPPQAGDQQLPTKMGASIRITAKGNVDTNALPSLVNQSMRDMNYPSGKQTIHVIHHDNTAQLNRIFYRDRIEEQLA